MDSILVSIKKMLGIESDFTIFDTDIIININSVIMGLSQIGLAPETGFIITDTTETWSDLLGDRIDVEAIKTYFYLKVRTLFDPPSSASVLAAMERQISELEWRIMVQVENAAYVSPVVVEEES